MSVPKTKASIRKLVLPRMWWRCSGSTGRQQNPGGSSRRPSGRICRSHLAPCSGGSISFWSGPGAKQIRFHDLRHTFATMALENGMDIKTLSAMLGHVSAATTLDIYTHITGDMLSDAAAKIDRGLGNEGGGERL